jgi:iron(III) transport system ATP-binding protein
MMGLKFQSITRNFGTRTAADAISLDISPGEFFSLLGPSGSGKSTLLRIAAGLEHPDSGSVVLGDRDITSLPPQERGIGMVFQNYALFPHMNVKENVAFGLRLRNLPAQTIARRVEETLARVDLAGRGGEHVSQLSGGEQQRVAVARALVIEPDLLLFDEPLSNLDVTLRQRTRMEIRALQKRTGITTIYVTHDQAEALSVSDRIAVIRNGRIEQVGTPMELYHQPSSAFVARFLGWENVIEGLALYEASSGEDSSWLCDADHIVLLSPEMVHLTSSKVPGAFSGVVERVEFRGASSLLIVRWGNTSLQAIVSGEAARQNWREGQPVWIEFDRSSARSFPKATL